MCLTIPKLRTWHLLGIVAASAALFSVMQFRWTVEDPGYALIRGLRSPDAAERAKAADGLLSHKPYERRAIAPLTEMLFDPDPLARRSAARALLGVVSGGDESELSPTRAALASALGDRDPAARLEIARTLGYLGAKPQVVVPTLIGFAGGPDPQARAEAVSILGQFGRQSEPALAALFAGLGDPDAKVRTWAVKSLAYCSDRPKPAPQPLLGKIQAALVGAADDPSPSVRASAVRALGTLAARMRIEIPRVVEALDDPDGSVRLMAAHYLCWNRPGQRSPALIPALVRALVDPDMHVRLCSTRTLGTLGLDAEAAIPPLRGLVDDPKDVVRDAATVAIEAIEKSAMKFRTVTLPGAIAELADADPVVRTRAANRLGEIGPRAADAVPALVRSLGDREASVRRAAVEALGQIGPEAANAAPDLTRLAESDPDERVRLAATFARSTLLRAGANP